MIEIGIFVAWVFCMLVVMLAFGYYSFRPILERQPFDYWRTTKRLTVLFMMAGFLGGFGRMIDEPADQWMTFEATLRFVGIVAALGVFGLSFFYLKTRWLSNRFADWRERERAAAERCDG
jgi:ABC-type Fe3+ transport system permease subunit